MRQYSDEKVTAQMLRRLSRLVFVKRMILLILRVERYIFTRMAFIGCFRICMPEVFFVMAFREYDINYALRSSDYKELVHQLQAQPQIMRRQEDCQTKCGHCFI